MNTTEKLVQGSIDMHVHHAPDAHTLRWGDASQIATQAEKMGMRAIVLKNHDYPTAPLASILNQYIHNLTVFGSLSLNYAVGGLNPSAVETSALLGAKVIWMPTSSSANRREKRGLGGGIKILDEDGKIVPAVRQILDIVKSYDMVLATGHIGREEVFALVDEARERGITKIVITHPLDTRTGAKLSIEEQQQMTRKGAFVEHCFGDTMPAAHRLDPMMIVEAVRAVGAEHCILSTDLGQDFNPSPAEGMRMMVATLVKCGLSAEEIEVMIKTNPAKLLGLV